MEYVFLAILFSAIFPAYIHAQFSFQDVTEQAGIYMLGSNSSDAGSGVLTFDLNGDGWDDLYLPGGLDSDKIFLNKHDGTFVPIIPANVAIHQHLGSQPWRSNTRGGIVFDYDNDGLPDLYITCENDDILWHNNGNYVFGDATDSAKLNRSFDQNESMSATFGDFNGDGWDDFYVARSWHQGCVFTDSNFVCHTFPKWFYINNHDGTFSEKAKEFGVDIGDTATTNIVLFFDYDRDGDLDLIVGNDNGMKLTPNKIFKNMLMETGIATFKDVSKECGLACPLLCMGITPCDYNCDGNFDFYETSVGPDSLMKNNGNGAFTNASNNFLPPREGFESHGGFYMTTNWSVIMGDFDNDGWEDAFVVHGTLGPNLFSTANWAGDPSKHDTSVFYHNIGGVFEDVTPVAMNGDYIDLKARGAAYFDYNHDGKLDIVVGSLTEDPMIKTSSFRLLKNTTANPGHWLEMRFVAKRTAKEAIGTIVDVWSGGVVHSRQVSTGGGFGSQSSLMQHVGLGEDDVADSIVVFWPCDKNRHRQIDRYFHVKADTMLTFVEQMDNTAAVTFPPKERSSMQLYPLPAREMLTVSNLPELLNHISIYNLLGVRYLDETVSGSTCQIPISNLHSGCYLISITSGAIIQNKLFIKE